MSKVGFIGVGNMGGTLAKVAVKALGAASVCVSSRTPEKARRFAEETGCTAASNSGNDFSRCQAAENAGAFG